MIFEIWNDVINCWINLIKRIKSFLKSVFFFYLKIYYLIVVRDKLFFVLKIYVCLIKKIK